MGVSNKGWFTVPGIRPGDRTIEEQMLGLAPALAEANGATVLDLGCAEGVISLAFAKAGAARVLGVELLQSHLDVARRICKGQKNVSFICEHLDDTAKRPIVEQFDIVLALGVIHKLHDPSIPLRFAARSCKRLICYRAPAASVNGVIRSKHSKMPCDVPAILKEEGFVEGETINGVRGEAVQYWRRA